jgi:hypothetical protein
MPSTRDASPERVLCSAWQLDPEELGEMVTKTDLAGQRGKPQVRETSRRLLAREQARGSPELSQVSDAILVHLQCL